MPTLTELSIPNVVSIVTYPGIYTGSQGMTPADIPLTVGNQSIINSVALDITVHVSPGYNTYYKMQGWNPLTQRYEDWHSMGTPLLIPPSGHTLENISIIGSWVDR